MPAGEVDARTTITIEVELSPLPVIVEKHANGERQMHVEGSVYIHATHFDVQCKGHHERARTNCRNPRRIRRRAVGSAKGLSGTLQKSDSRDSRNSRDSRTRGLSLYAVFSYFHGLGNGKSFASSRIDRERGRWDGKSYSEGRSKALRSGKGVRK